MDPARRSASRCTDIMLLLEGKASGVGRFPALHYARSALYSHGLTSDRT
jgi:hypothetical protein